MWSARYQVVAIPDDDMHTAYPVGGPTTLVIAHAERERLARTVARTRFVVLVHLYLDMEDPIYGSSIDGHRS
jgi:hypothetical protein